MTTVSLSAVKILWIANDSTNDGDTLLVGNAASNQWSAPWSGSTVTEKVMASSVMLKSNLLLQGTNPWTVDGTHKSLKLDAGAFTIPYRIVILGI